jgi:N-acetylmuramoyl-L-alanine amidase CwlD
MISKSNKRIIVNMLIASLLLTLSMFSNTAISYADNSIENEFASVINKYNPKDVVVENGISLRMGETLDGSQYIDWNLSNNTTVQVNENNIIKSVNPGTVFLTYRIGDKVHIIEIYVPEEKVELNTNLQMSQVSTGYSLVNRNYYKVFIDPGHGGSDPGALGFGNIEKNLNLQVATKVKSKLESKGIEVRMSRTSDIYLALSERAKLANDYGADTFISIHQNSVDNAPTVNGIETFYHTNKTTHKPYAESIQNNLIKETGATNRGVKTADFAVLRETNMPSSLAECGFISNQQESAKLSDSYYQDKLATAIANGIETYLKSNIDLGSDNSSESVINTGTVNSSSLNVRSGPGTSYSIIGTLASGSKVEIIASQDGWYKIKYNTGYGYVSSSYITIDNSPIEFNDINNHWAKTTIEDFASKGYIGGYEDGTFRPDNPITRAEFVKIVNKVFGFTQIGSESFTDVNISDWFYNDICVGINAGYTNGYEDNTFRPNRNITREEAASIVASVVNLNSNGILNFKDVDKIASWAKASVDELEDNKIMGGYEDSTFRPKNNITRAEAVVTLSRIVK